VLVEPAERLALPNLLGDGPRQLRVSAQVANDLPAPGAEA